VTPYAHARPASMDPRLVDDLQSADPSCRHRGLQRAYAELGPAVQRVALGLLGSRAAAEDVVQDTFLAVARSAGSFGGEGSLEAWVLTIAANLARRAIVREHTGRHVVTEWSAQHEARRTPAHGPDGSEELQERITAALQRLPPPQRLAISLSVVDGLCADDIARILGCPVGTVWSRIHHAKQRLAHLLQDLHPTRDTRP